MKKVDRKESSNIYTDDYNPKLSKSQYELV